MTAFDEILERYLIFDSKMVSCMYSLGTFYPLSYLSVLDSSLITPSGLIAGDNTQFGHPDECIHTQIPVRNFYPKYCLPTARYAPFRTLYPEYYGQSLYDWPPYDMEKNIWDFIRVGTIGTSTFTKVMIPCRK